jgi:GNAT superfamily N-acetyltransferase
MITVRPASLPEDKPVLLDFIVGLQRFEAEFEADRRLDATYAEDQFADLMKNHANGAIFLAADEGRPVGWVMVYESEGKPYVIDDERRQAVICELFVSPETRGKGAGRALLAACEDWARGRGIAVIHIGHLSANARASEVYEQAGYAPYVLLRRKRL